MVTYKNLVEGVEMSPGLSLGKYAAMNCSCPGVDPGPTLASTCGGAAFMLFMGLLETFLKSQCDVEDPCNRARSRTILDSEYDFIVVGGGSAGAVVAGRLSEVPHFRVLLIEAGMDEPTGTQVPSMFLNYLGSDIDWGYKTEPEENACLSYGEKRCYWPRGKVLGGTSVLNGMMYMRGSRYDYDWWHKLGNEGWSYQDVLPYFLKSEDNEQIDEMDGGFHATGGPLTVTRFPYQPPLSYAIVKAGEELGYPTRDVNGNSQSGFMIAQTTSKKGTRLSSAKAFIRPVAKNRPNLHVLLNTTATKVLIDPKTKTAYGVEFVKDGGSVQKAIARNEVILSGGAVNSPQLLLLSGVGPSDELRKVNVVPIHHLPGVGRNLHNHVAHFLKFYLNDKPSAPLNWATAMEYLLYRDGLMSGTGISSVTGFVKTKLARQDIDHPDVQMFFGGYLADCAKSGQIGEQAHGEESSRRVVNIFPAVLHPKSRGYLKLKDNNPFSHPAIYAKYLTHKDDVTTLVEAIKIAIKLSETEALKKFGMELDKTPVKGCENQPFGTDQYWECAVRHDTGPENHQAGSCRMGPSKDVAAVVDNELRVHGIDRLRVIDTSIMPSVTSGNTNAPAIMIGEKGADMIKQRWLGPKTWSKWRR